MLFSSLFANPRLALYAFCAVAASGFGQTFFVSMMGEAFRTSFALSHTVYGSVYSGATIASALLLLRFGSLADTWSLPRVTGLAVLVLSAGCLSIGAAPNALLLGFGFVCIRFGGQGFMSHLGITTAARYFPAHRGSAVALAAFGFPLAEALLPAGAALGIEHIGWRWPWFAASGILLFGIWPLLAVLARKTPAPVQDTQVTAQPEGQESFTREQVLRDPGLYLLLPAAVATPFVVTALFFHQAAIGQMQGWSLSTLASAFTGYAAAHLVALCCAGPVVDRIGALRTLPLALYPMLGSLVVLAGEHGNGAALLYMGLLGTTQGFASTAAGAVWAERYGVVHLGAIRAMFQAVMVVSTAIAPLLFGFLLDQQLNLAVLSLGTAGAVFAASCLALCCPPGKTRLVQETIPSDSGANQSKNS